MKAKELTVQKLNSGAYYTEGDDRYWLERTKQTFISIPPSDLAELSLHIIEKPSSSDQILEALQTISFFSPVNVVIVIGGTLKLDAKKKELDTLTAYIDEKTYLLFTECDFLTAADKKKLTEISCVRSDIYDTREEIYNMIKKSDIEPAAVELLMVYTNRDLLRISGEIAKLVAYADGRKITVADVELLVANSVENNIFEFTEAVATGNSKKAMLVLERFTSRGVSYAYLLSVLSGQYRRMLHGTLSKKSDAELAEKLGTKEFAIKKAREATGYGKKLRPAYLKKCVDMLTDAELNFKSGVMSEETAFKSAVTELLVVK